jgi:hypothetical protein
MNKRFRCAALAGAALLLLSQAALAESGETILRLKSEQAQGQLELNQDQQSYRERMDEKSLPPEQQRAIDQQLERERVQQRVLDQQQLDRERAAARQRQQPPPAASGPRNRTSDQLMRRERQGQSLQNKILRPPAPFLPYSD